MNNIRGMMAVDNILISVIIPYYNCEKYIEQAVESVINQPYKNVEILLINDGSPDNGVICKKIAFKYDRVKYYEKGNQGIGATRNYGMERANGDYMAFLDQDDVWVNDFLTHDIVEKIINGGDVVAFSYYNCNGDLTRGKLVEVTPKKISGGGITAVNSLYNHHSSMFFKRKTIIDNEIRYPLTRHEDVIFVQKCLYVSKSITAIDKVMFLYRNNTSSETHKMQKTELLYGPLLKSWKDLERWYHNYNPEDKEIISYVNQMICIYAIEGIEMLYQSDRCNKDIKQVIDKYFAKEYLDSYEQIVQSDKQKQRISEFYDNKKQFVRKNQMIGYRYRFMKKLMQIPIIRKAYYRKKYPVVLK
jgi:glycosyltransferase involved in cell wall biosynthesis